MLKATTTSLELEKPGFLDKVAMLEHDVRKLNSDLNESTLKNTDLHTNMVRLEDWLCKVNEDMPWV